MDWIYTLSLIAHIVAGVIALLTGLISIVSKKGGPVHVKSGSVFYGAMIVVLISSLTIQIVKFIPFLMMVALFTSYFVFNGKRVLRYKNRNLSPDRLDTISAALMMFFGMIMLIYTFNGAPLAIVMGIFGVASIGIGASDLLIYRKPDKVKNWWLLSHINGMGGAYIATVTAVVVVNAQYIPFAIPSVIYWVAPGIIGSILINRTVRSYTIKPSIVKGQA